MHDMCGRGPPTAAILQRPVPNSRFEPPRSDFHFVRPQLPAHGARLPLQFSTLQVSILNSRLIFHFSLHNSPLPNLNPQRLILPFEFSTPNSQLATPNSHFSTPHSQLPPRKPPPQFATTNSQLQTHTPRPISHSPTINSHPQLSAM